MLEVLEAGEPLVDGCVLAGEADAGAHGAGFGATSIPSMVARPPSGRRRVVRIRTVVVLPAPLGPSRPSTVPGATERSTPREGLGVAEALDEALCFHGGTGGGHGWYDSSGVAHSSVRTGSAPLALRRRVRGSVGDKGEFLSIGSGAEVRPRFPNASDLGIRRSRGGAARRSADASAPDHVPRRTHRRHRRPPGERGGGPGRVGRPGAGRRRALGRPDLAPNLGRARSGRHAPG